MNQPNDLSFLPDDYVASRARARATRLCGALLATAIITVAAAFTFAEQSLRDLRIEHAQVSEQFRRESERLRRLETIKRDQEAVAARANLSEALVEKAPRSELLADIKDSLPAGTALADFVMSSRVVVTPKTPEQLLAEKKANREKKVAAPEPKIYETSVRITGIAYNDGQVAQFINAMTKSRYFKDVNLLVSREQQFDGQAVRRFELEMSVRAMPLPKPDAADNAVATTEERSSR